uniref:Rho GTPase activating protein 22 n=1 Tax=Hucho hucho TaxID=62062 RepID=A0A4W5QKE7_9TELE
MANSQRDTEEWVRAIQRAIWAPLGGGYHGRSHCIFGQHLEETMQCESGCGSSSKTVVPLLVHQCVCFIHQHGLAEEGLFRMPGQTNHVRELQDAFDCGEKPLFDSNTDVHTVASLLKLYLRELPEPVVPFNKYTEFLSTAQLLTKDKEEGIFELGRQVRTLPQVNYNLLKYICRFLDEVQSHCSQNMMSVQNLATVFGPNILRPKMEDAQTMKGTVVVQHLMTVLISEHSRLKEGDSEGKSDGRTEGKMERKSEGKNERKLSGGSGAVLGPSKQFKSLSSWRSSLKGGSGSIGVRRKIGGSAVDMSTVTVGNWLMNGLSPFHSHRRTASTGKQLKESSLSLNETHKNSLPDSYTGSSLSIKYSSHSQRSSLKDSSPLHIDSSYSSIDSSFPNMNAGCSKGDPGDDITGLRSGVNEGLFSLVTELKEELRGQRFSYETRIRKLEESCSGLHLQSGRLEEDLNQEKKRFRMLEIRLGISKRARQDAETWNVLLQKEKEFWET